jgi:DNA mismatch endonuclease (patch repair protein)
MHVNSLLTFFECGETITGPMGDVFTKAKRSAVMAAVRSTQNKSTELRLVAIFRGHGIKGWRRHTSFTGRPDFTFIKQRVAVFVDGCFWHGCRSHCRMPQTNQQYWQRKIERNAARDRRVNQQLRKAGWRVIRIWAHSLKSPRVVARRVISVLCPPPENCKNRIRK